MFAYLRGHLVRKNPTSCVVDVNGVGYHLSIPLSTYEKIEEGRDHHLHTYLLVKDDKWELYGFFTTEEKDLFESLIGVRGIGGKLAIVILSGLTPVRFWESIRDADVDTLSSVKGVGAKTAKRLILELKDRLIIEEPSVQPVSEDAVLALMSLGYGRAEARRAIQKVNIESDKVEEIIKEALKAG
jgi:Holliday junction DNA helicase RuvA